MQSRNPRSQRPHRRPATNTCLRCVELHLSCEPAGLSRVPCRECKNASAPCEFSYNSDRKHSGNLNRNSKETLQLKTSRSNRRAPSSTNSTGALHSKVIKVLNLADSSINNRLGGTHMVSSLGDHMLSSSLLLSTKQ
ncbi:hypothetical protein BT69DRAFT_683283 [Atractiella rhizophila]|nr:hypothetical protein BT69DRAFT_683283 [Atractiella rhizophila]